MKKLIYTVAIMFIIANSFAYSNAQNYLQVLSSDASKLIIKADINFERFDTVIIDGNKFYKPIISSLIFSGNESGAPNYPLLIESIIVPNQIGAKIASIKAVDVQKYDLPIAPAPFYNETSPYFAFDSSIYFKNIKSDFAELQYIGKHSGEHISKLKIYGAISENNLIIIPKSIIIEINFDKYPLSASVQNEYLFALNNNLSGVWNATNSVKYKKNNDNKILNLDNTFKLKIEKEGLYTITANDLNSLGIAPTKEIAEKIKIYGIVHQTISLNKVPKNGELNQIPSKVITNNDGVFESIIFYGAPAQGIYINKSNTIKNYDNIDTYINPYTKINSYLLSFNDETPLRIEEVEPLASPAVNSPDYYTATIYSEEDIYNAYAEGGGLTWFGKQLESSNTFPYKLSNIKKDDNLKVSYTLTTGKGIGGDLLIKVFENQKSLGQFMMYNGEASRSNSFSVKTTNYTIPSSSFSGDDSFFKITTTASNGLPVGYLDKILLTYPSYLIPNNNEITLITSSDLNGLTEYSINGFDGANIYCFDITSSDSIKLLKNNSNIGSMFSLKTILSKNKLKRFYISSNLRKPIIEKIQSSNLRAQNYEKAVLITHQDLYSSALKYKEFRKLNDGIDVDIIKLNDIYNEFGYGMSDPLAIRNFLRYALDNSNENLRYVVLWGDGHYDYRNIQTQKINYIPPYEVEHPSLDELSYYPCDDYYVYLESGTNKVVSLALGRIIINTNTEGNEYVSKLIDYQNNSSKDEWRATISLVADDSQGGSGDNDTFTTDSETLSKLFPKDLIQKKLYMGEYPVEYIPGARRKPLATQQFVSIINNDGSALINWIGHGNPRVLAHEELFNRESTLQEFNNRNKMFFFVGATCDFARYDNYETQSGAERMLSYQNGGAIGLFAASRSVFGSYNQEMLLEFYKYFFKRNETNGDYPRIGDIVAYTKIIKSTFNDEKFCLLSDPLLKIVYPDKRIQIDSINGIATNDTLQAPLIKALSEVKVSGRILNPNQEIDDNFNGSVALNMFDSDIAYTAVDEVGIGHSIVKYGGALNKGAYPVVNGAFSATYIIPQDIAFTNKNGRLIAFARSDSGEYAKGFTNNFKVGDIESRVNDNFGPEIKIYFDNRTFKNGDLVRKDPLLIVDLSDETGVNATGSGIGHKIEAWLDNNANSIDLTNKFTTSINSYNSGFCEKQLFDLKPGNHTLRVRAWDVFNNYSVKYADFKVEGGYELHSATAFPNPSEDGNCKINFKHNLNAPFSVDLEIFNSFGQSVNKLSFSITTNFTGEISWDGLDYNNNAVSSGAYYYNITSIKEGVSNQETSGMISILK